NAIATSAKIPKVWLRALCGNPKPIPHYRGIRSNHEKRPLSFVRIVYVPRRAYLMFSICRHYFPVDIPQIAPQAVIIHAVTDDKFVGYFEAHVGDVVKPVLHGRGL